MESGKAVPANYSDSHRWYGKAVLTLIILAGASLQAMAGPQVPEPAYIPRAEPQFEFPRTESPGISDSARPAMRAPGSEETIQIQVDGFRFSGNHSIDSATLEQVVQSYIGRKLNIEELNRAANLVTSHYRQQGFLLAQAYLPEQEIANNIIEIAIMEGALGELGLNAAEGLDEVFLGTIAGRNLQSADTIRENNLIRNVTVLNSLPGIKAVASLNPGEAVGTSDARIEISKEPRWRGIIGANTFGNRFTGREVLSGTLLFNNPAGRGDQLALSLRSSNHEQQRAAHLNYLTPVHASGTLLSLQYGYVDYRLGGEFSPLRATGDSEYYSLGVDQPFIRGRLANVTGRMTLSHKDISDEVATFALKNKRNINAVELGIFADWRDKQEAAFNQIGFQIKHGYVDFRDDLAELLDDTGARTAGDFLKYSLFASRVQPISARLNLNLHAEYQGSNKNLDIAEKMVIGGINRWRAFADLPTSADRGWVAGMELRANYGQELALANFLHANSLSPYVFYDAGRGNINHVALSDDNHVRSSHAGIGVDAAIGERWYLGLTWSQQKRDVDGSGTERERRAWGQIQVTF